MAKFYVQTGTLKLTIEAVDERRAALWSMHRAISQVLPLESGFAPELTETPKAMGPIIEINEVGFDQPAVCTYETLDVLEEWSQLLTAAMRLEELELAQSKSPSGAAPRGSR